MRTEFSYFHCDDALKVSLAREIAELQSVIAATDWAESL